MRRFTFAEIWDVLVFVILFPLVLGLGVQLPGDWAHHQGASLPGTATVTALDDFRGGKIVLVDVRDRSGHVVTRRQEVSGEAPRLMGATFAVLYLPSDEPGDTQVYVAGHDPFAENAAVLVPVGLAWLVSSGRDSSSWRGGSAAACASHPQVSTAPVAATFRTRPERTCRTRAARTCVTAPPADAAGAV